MAEGETSRTNKCHVIMEETMWFLAYRVGIRCLDPNVLNEYGRLKKVNPFSMTHEKEITGSKEEGYCITRYPILY